jgi:hypothetical protein
MTRDEQNTRIDAELLCGETPKDVSDKYSVPYPTVALRAKKLKDATNIPSELVDDNITKATLEIIRDKIAAEAPKIARQADLIIDGLEGLKVLNEDIQKALTKVVTLATSMLDEEDEDGNSVISKRDLQILASVLTSVYSTINAKGTTVNVATSVSTGEQNMSFFKANVRSV